MVRFLLVVVLCALPAVASAQAWADAYQAGNYQKAAELLQQVVIESAQDTTTALPEPYRRLALMYVDGLGVDKDPIAACMLAQMAGSTMMMSAPKLFGADFRAYEAAIKESEEFVRTRCESLTPDDRLAAGRSMGCFAFGMPEETITLGGRSVRLGRRGVSLADTAKPWELNACPQLVARVRTTSLAPPSDAEPGVGARHFIEIFSWIIGMKDGSANYFLQWDVYEVANERIHFFLTGDHLAARSSWPGRELPAEVEQGLTLEMIRSGHVRWKLEGSPPKRGWFMIGEGVKR